MRGKHINLCILRMVEYILSLGPYNEVIIVSSWLHDIQFNEKKKKDKERERETEREREKQKVNSNG